MMAKIAARLLVCMAMFAGPFALPAALDARAAPAPRAAEARLAETARAYTPLESGAPLQDLNFYVLTLIERTPDTRAAMARSRALEAVSTTVRARVAAAAAACERATAAAMASAEPPTRAPDCSVDRVRWTPDEAAAAEQAAGALFDASPAVRALVRDHMRPSGYFALHAGLSDRALFVRAWRDAHANIDRIIRVYGLGEKPYFADIDSVIYPIDGRYYQGFLASLVREVARAARPGDPAYAAPLRLAMELMSANRRDDAVRFGRLEAEENAATAKRMAGLDWSRFKYPAVLVPGHSPEIAYEPLNPNAKLRLRRGVEMYRAGLTPILVVSGGSLRPIGTSFVEALEMKRFLVAEMGVPTDAILIDPVARHTTTNLRNTVRLMLKYGAPVDRPSVVVGNSVPYIAAERFSDRCLKELGYAPYTPGARLDFEALEFTPSLTSLHRDASDPMDP